MAKMPDDRQVEKARMLIREYHEGFCLPPACENYLIEDFMKTSFEGWDAQAFADQYDCHIKCVRIALTGRMELPKSRPPRESALNSGLELISFVDERLVILKAGDPRKEKLVDRDDEKLPWSDIALAWNAAHPDRRFKSSRSIKSKYFTSKWKYRVRIVTKQLDDIEKYIDSSVWVGSPPDKSFIFEMREAIERPEDWHIDIFRAGETGIGVRMNPKPFNSRRAEFRRESKPRDG